MSNGWAIWLSIQSFFGGMSFVGFMSTGQSICLVGWLASIAGVFFCFNAQRRGQRRKRGK